MDQSLDEIIKSRPRTNRRRSAGRNARASVLGSGASGVTPRSKAAVKAGTKTVVATPAAPTGAQSQIADKIMVSNLPQDVNEQQVKELFSQTVGPLREVTLHYDAAGRSKGVASVQFSRKGDGHKAFNQYNNRLIDGKRPMKIEIVMDPTKAPAPSLASRVAPATTAAAGGAPARGGPRKRGVGRGRGGRRGGGTDRPAKSAADLDAEMEDYTNNTSTAAPTAAPTTA
ncbi:RNA-binding RNA annealing protein [Stygiomarasmius scandens]|uniref:RNA-binding RNA annealing protein n=1 Tax=Marasmiellus scandens TaxID=2682957 RepID=A0ABR1JL06_9AGAR